MEKNTFCNCLPPTRSAPLRSSRGGGSSTLCLTDLQSTPNSPLAFPAYFLQVFLILVHPFPPRHYQACFFPSVERLETDRNPNCCYVPKPNILLNTNYSANFRILEQNSTHPIVSICNYSVLAEYSVRYSAENFGRNRFRSDSM